MKNQIVSSMIAIGFVALSGTTPAAAQARQKATIPFAFEASGVEYPEGEYTLERLTARGVIKITNVANRHAALIAVPIQSGKPIGSDGKLVFDRSADRLRLNEVWFAGYPGMLTISRAKEVSARVVVNLK